MATLPPDWTPDRSAPWDVHRRWVTRLGRETLGRRARRRLRRSGRGLDSTTSTSSLADLDGILLVLAALAFLAFFVLVIGPLLVLAVEVLVGLVVVLLGAAARVLFRRPWSIDAVGADGTHLRWKEVGWSASGRRVTAAAAALAAGDLPPAAELVHPGDAPPPPGDGPTDGSSGPFGAAGAETSRRPPT